MQQFTGPCLHYWRACLILRKLFRNLTVATGRLPAWPEAHQLLSDDEPGASPFLYVHVYVLLRVCLLLHLHGMSCTGGGERERPSMLK